MSKKFNPYDLNDVGKHKNLESILKELDYYEKYREYESKKTWDLQKVWEQRETELQKQIKNNSINVILNELLKRYSEEDVLELLDIKEIQQFLRKKKLQELKDKK